MSALADLVLVVHALFVGFVVIGFALVLLGLAQGWFWVRRPAFRYAHLTAIAIVVAQAWLGLECPLTTLETALRVRAGEAGYGTSFIQDWLYRLLYYRADTWVFTVLYTAFGAMVALVWWFAPPVHGQSARDRLD
ncbi:MAG: DUF2784 domain-containing protein [Gammaproteobacteria bacterium]